MTENTSRNVLAELEAFEAVAFRIGQLARRLRTENPDLPATGMLPTVWVLAGMDGPAVHADLEIECDSVDDVRAWAKALDVEATVTTDARSPYKRAAAEVLIVGVTVKVSGSQTLTGDEYTAWRAAREQAALATAAAGGAE
jgi:hypothetical protein